MASSAPDMMPISAPAPAASVFERGIISRMPAEVDRRCATSKRPTPNAEGRRRSRTAIPPGPEHRQDVAADEPLDPRSPCALPRSVSGVAGGGRPAMAATPRRKVHPRRQRSPAWLAWAGSWRPTPSLEAGQTGGIGTQGRGSVRGSLVGLGLRYGERVPGVGDFSPRGRRASCRARASSTIPMKPCKVKLGKGSYQFRCAAVMGDAGCR